MTVPKLYEVHYKDYRDIDEDSRGFVQSLLFLQLIETVSHNRSHMTGPQTLQEIINNDMQEYETVLNYEACWLYKDTRNRFREDILEIDMGYKKI